MKITRQLVLGVLLASLPAALLAQFETASLRHVMDGTGAVTLWSEVRKLQFRTEYFNIMNKTNFQAPNSTSSNTAFGPIGSAFPARVIQMALKLVF